MTVLIVRTFPYELNLDAYNCQEIGLALALRKKGVACDIVLYTKGKDRDETRPDGVTIYYRHALNFFKNGIFKNLEPLLDRYDVIQVHEYDQIQSWSIYTKYAKKKHNVVLYHGPYYDPFNKGYNFKCSVFDRLYLSRSKEAKKSLPCITKSPQAADFLKSKGFRHVYPVGVGLNPAPFDEAPDNTIADTMPKDKTNLIYIGVLEERRNTKLLLDIINFLSSDRDDFHFTIVGKGTDDYMQSIKSQMDQLEKEGVLTYVPSAPQRQVAGIYRKADLMLFPSNYDIFGMVLLEAMYCGVAVISSNNGGAETLIENGKDGIILNDFDINTWVDVTESLINNKAAMRSMEQAAKEKIKTQFTWDALAERFVKVYESVKQ